MSPGTKCAIGTSFGWPSRSDGRLDADHRPEFGGSGIGPGLLNEAQNDTENHHQQHDAPGPEVAGEKRRSGEHEQQDHERVDQGFAQQANARVALVPRHDIRAVFVPRRSASSSERPILRCVKFLQHLFGVRFRRLREAAARRGWRSTACAVRAGSAWAARQ